MSDDRAARGLLTWIPRGLIGRRLFPDIAVSEHGPVLLREIVADYERRTGRNIVVAVNGGYFLDNRTVPRDHPEWLGRPVGFLKCEGRVVSGPFFDHRPLLCIGYDHHCSLRLVTKGLCSPKTNALAEAYVWQDVAGEFSAFCAVIEAGPLLINQGRTAMDLSLEQWGTGAARASQAAPVKMTDLRTLRTVVAMTGIGAVCLVTVLGCIPESVGMTHEETAVWLKTKIPDIAWALEMDAGVSVGVWHRELGITSCMGELERPVASAILLAVEPGDNS